ncbi:sigma-70 family RNA polymerase sigma factor [Brevibacillus laterosporus]|uniref:sigma-70 family RNA polymerase sigma factor n=1 Tax=Brevibacillus laterosporus TaxID=1465 RepID=UPI00036DB583|nr:sigma-70 family RNA polymerase sigma factor [Brevibacillus laterosporus]MED2003676.1 sigma-70 family RNA polymerase sigma factor [Brevibacillus laterosporus]MED4764358.1 sigma-70 family RNA polymerase sigma factor [Brevibacillus laterosporus]TPH22690.1 sigma-70 family RNA polymerase sigma factor [Brevibacillus laterosporus]
MEIARVNTGISQNPTSKPKYEILSTERFAELYDAYYMRVYHYICYRVNNHYTAEEICSHVFEMVISKYSSFNPDKSNFEVWLFAIARNAVTDYFRSQKKKMSFSLESILDMVLPKSSPEEIVIRGDNNQALFKALAKLSDKERNIIAMKYGAGLKNTEIAVLLGVSGSNIGVVLYRCLKKLQTELERGGFQYEE